VPLEDLKMLSVPFFTPIAYEIETVSLVENILEVVDSYFYLGGNKAFVISSGDDGTRESILKEDSPSFIATALKIATYFSLILPFIVLLAKAMLRSCYTFLLQTKVIEKKTKEEEPPTSSSPPIEEEDQEVYDQEHIPDELELTPKMIKTLQEELENDTALNYHRKGHVSRFEVYGMEQLTFLCGEGETENDYTLGAIDIAKIFTLYKKGKQICKKKRLDLIVLPKFKEFQTAIRGIEMSLLARENLKVKRDETVQKNLYETLPGLKETNRQLEIFTKALRLSPLNKKEIPILDDSPDFKENRRVAVYLEGNPSAQKPSNIN
jgi:hypothetical protein